MYNHSVLMSTYGQYLLEENNRWITERLIFVTERLKDLIATENGSKRNHPKIIHNIPQRPKISMNKTYLMVTAGQSATSVTESRPWETKGQPRRI